uniref:Uncharacterized protein n=1 Tax=uncultured prokaryote TaxID=198431 RepID=A0A0H5Q8T1_9ZZZZ|nr:hypothetical protein [uncultured prokaryote]
MAASTMAISSIFISVATVSTRLWMDKYHLSLVPGIVGGTTKVEPYPYKKTKTTKGGEIYEENVNEVLVSADMTWTWVNNDNPEEKVVVGWTLVGQQSDASQAFGSGLTYSDRYFLLKYFNVATTDDDPDAHRSKQRAAEAAEDKMIAEQIIGTFDEVVKMFLKENESKAEDVKKFVSKYAKGGNYFAITESTLAAKLLDDFKETFKICDKCLDELEAFFEVGGDVEPHPPEPVEPDPDVPTDPENPDEGGGENPDPGDGGGENPDAGEGGPQP